MEQPSEQLRLDVEIFGYAFFMMTRDGGMKRIPPEAVIIDLDKLKRASEDQP